MPIIEQKNRHGAYLEHTQIPRTPLSASSTNPTAMSPKRLITSQLTGAGSHLTPVYSKAWTKGTKRYPQGIIFLLTGCRPRQTCGRIALSPVQSEDTEKKDYLLNFCRKHRHIVSTVILISDIIRFNSHKPRENINATMTNQRYISEVLEFAIISYLQSYAFGE
ncbi:hypothetical protein TNCV_1133291 [Trichonephila clavipes]|nr:hypothetical protein TNCV_1133291 [Trichonephila clavipes]